MAVMIPDWRKTRVVFASRAEEQFYEACHRQLGKQWRVFYSCVLSAVEGNKGIVDNEIDFVLYHPRYGLIVVEVKGGRIRYNLESNNFFSINGKGQTFAIKNPFQQALAWKSRFIRWMKTENVRLPVTQAVSFPTVSADDFPRQAGIEPDVIIDRDRINNLEFALKEMVTKSQPAKFLNFNDCGDAIQSMIAGKDFSTKHYFRDYIDMHEGKVRDLESFQDSIVQPVAASRRLGVEGEAGTGKTYMAVKLADYFRSKGKKVLLLSSNDILNAELKSYAGAGVEVKTYREVAEEQGINLLQKPEGFDGTSDDWIQYEAPDRLAKALDANQTRYQVILCDEAQDVQPFWWDVIEKLLDPRDKENRLYIFFDRSQGVFGSGSSDQGFVPEDVLPVEQPYFPLVNNYRMTREITSFSRNFRTGKQIFEGHSSRLGYLPEIIAYDSIVDAQEKLQQLVHRLVSSEKLSPEEMTILSARKPHLEPSVLAGVNRLDDVPLQFLRRGAIPITGGMKVSTVGMFKGLETNVGILVNFSEYNMPLSNPIMASLMYVACTRAKHMLYVFVRRNSDKHRELQQALKQLHMSGGLVIDPVSDHEFVGEVVHYNPDRVGWLEVQDPRLDLGDVMFFPDDVRRGKIPRVRVGDRVLFRPRREGSATIACDLRLTSA